MPPLYLAIFLCFGAFALALLDIFVPSGGLLLVLAGLAALASILFGFQAGMYGGMLMLTLVATAVPLFVVLAIRIWPHTPIGRRVILKLPELANKKVGYWAPAPQEALVGCVFVAESELLPSGQVRVGHRHYNAIAESGIIETGQHFKIIAYRERNLIARLTSEPVTPVAELPAELTGLTPTHNARPLAQPAPSPESLLDRPAEELGLDSLDESSSGS
ncbi:NfeD family protein [Aureliella helgolandensis]|uniref:NfeD-like C-terminal domain-containing protein n=1 Tax=Aureliella helgolandensis TaxID=2527968 RepID=A0A518GAN2_9BACT|nr:NfeD family protein [Aureliella helgolandensis]QDV25655.1 hypothetical protein Q31a_39810 [Aureliella helgolandensis]